jgi:hypothetical protein
VNASTILRQTAAEGVRLELAADGGLEITGDEESVRHWLPTIRVRRKELIAELYTRAERAASDEYDAKRTRKEAGRRADIHK